MMLIVSVFCKISFSCSLRIASAKRNKTFGPSSKKQSQIRRRVWKENWSWILWRHFGTLNIPVHKNWGSSTPLLAKCWKSTFNYIIDICMQEIIAIFAKTTWLWMLVFTNLWTIKNHRLHVNWHLSYLIKPLIIEMCCWKPLWNCLQNLALQRKILMINVTVLIRYCWHN